MSYKIGLIGLGVMGNNHARVIRENSRVSSLKVLDTNRAVLERVASTYNAEIATSLDQFQDCDAVVIATATHSHKDIAAQLIEFGVPMLIEKPICLDYEETKQLLKNCVDSNIIVTCGFVERFNPAFTTAQRFIDQPVRHFMSYRHSPHNSRVSSHVITDLLIHDLDLLSRVGPRFMSPSVAGFAWMPQSLNYYEVVDSILSFPNQMTAVLTASRWGQRKIREVRISTDDLLIEIDLLRVTVTTYQYRSQGSSPTDPASYRAETVVEVPFVRHTNEPLAAQFEHFLSLIDGDIDPELEVQGLLPAHQWASQIENYVDNVS